MNSDKRMNALDGSHSAYPSRKRLNHRGPLSIDVASAWYFITICETIKRKRENFWFNPEYKQ